MQINRLLILQKGEKSNKNTEALLTSKLRAGLANFIHLSQPEHLLIET